MNGIYYFFLQTTEKFRRGENQITSEENLINVDLYYLLKENHEGKCHMFRGDKYSNLGHMIKLSFD